jgi:putative DNA primase/helicase
VADPDNTFTPREVSAYYAARLPDLKQRPTAEWRGACPIHEGKNDNFAVDRDTGLWFCHSTCGRGGDMIKLEMELAGKSFAEARAEVFRLAGRIEPDNWRNGTRTNGNSAGTGPSKPTKPTRTADGLREVARYPYVDADGNLLYEVVRFEDTDGEKTFRQCRPDGRGGIIRNLDGVEQVPYRLPELLKAETVYLPEGEKDVHTLEGWGLVASCNPGGSGNSHLYAAWAGHFRGRHIVILPDNDAPGRKHAAAVAAALLGVAASVKIVELPNLPAKGDVTDWKEAGGTGEQLSALLAEVAPLDAPGLAALRDRWGLANTPTERTTRAQVGEEWPTPEPLAESLPPVLPFDEWLLPEAFRQLVADVTERMQVPMDYPAVAIVLCLAGVVNRRAVVQPKALDSSWVVVPNLWGAIIAPPGFMKSPVISAITRPLTQIQAEWRREHQAAMAGYASAKEEFELLRAAWKEQYKAASKKSRSTPDRPGEEPAEPRPRRLIVNDATFEALHQTMNENPAGLLAIRDELVGWLSQLDRAGREGERAFCLQAWNGDTGHTIDRIGRGTIHVEHCCMSMLGGIQPGRLRPYLIDALEDGPTNDGLIQRFQLLVWPDTPADWKYIDRSPDATSERRAEGVMRRLAEIDPEDAPRFRFAADAQELFVDWLAELEAKVRGDELHPALVSHLSKYRKLMPALALLFELADRATEGFPGFEGGSWGDQPEISLAQAQRAAGWCEYLESHARRVYSCVVTLQLRAARELAEKIRARKVGADGSFSCREVYTKDWSGLRSPEAVKHAAEVLQDAGWVRELPGEPGPFGGRPSNRYLVNPRVWT